MRALIVLVLAASAVGCTRWSMDHHLNNAYRAYDRGDCARVMLELSQVDRTSRARPFIHPEVSLLRGQCTGAGVVRGCRANLPVPDPAVPGQ